MPTLTSKDPIDQSYDERFTATALHQAETTPGTTDMSGFEQSVNGPDATPGELSTAEQTAGRTDAPWQNNTTRPSTVPSTFRGRITRLAKNKYAASGFVGVLLGGGILGLGMLAGPALLLQHLTANYFNRFNLQQTSIDVRSDKILRQMFSDKGPTSGVCGENVTFLCKFNQMSDKTLYAMANNPESRVIPLDKDGKPMDVKNSALFKSRPASFEYTDSLGAKKTIAAAEFANAYRNNEDFRLAMSRTLNPRWQAMNDNVIKKVFAFFKFSKGDTLKGKTTEKDINAAIDEQANSDSKVNATNATEQPTDNDTEEQKNAKEAANKNTNEVLKDMSPDAVVENGAVKKLTSDLLRKNANVAAFGVTAYCTIAEGAKGLSTAVRGAQMAVAVRAALNVARVSDQARKGDATPEVVSTVANRLTATTTDSNGNIIKGTATDGWGLRNGLSNEMPSNKKANYMKFLPGAGSAAALGTLASKMGANNTAVQKSCGVVNSTAGQIGLAIIGGPAAIVGFLAGSAMAPLLEGVVGNLMERLIGVMVGKYFDSTVVGEDYGNVMDIGMRNFYSDASAASGGGAMGRDQAANYEQLNSHVAATYARDDRATLSPLDASNPNTALGSIYSRFVPLIVSMGSLSGFVSQLGSVTSSGLSALMMPASYAAGTAQDYSQCDDPNMADIAAGPACNIIVGIPVDTLRNTSIDEVLKYNEGQYDEMTGEVKEKFDGTDITTPLWEWQTNCLPGTSDAAKFVENCKMDTKAHQMAALFFVDRRTMRMINSEDGSDESQGAASSTGSGGFVSGDTIELAKQILASPNVKFQVEPQQRKWFEEIAATGKQSGCGGVAISPKLMGVILGISQKYKITIGVLVNGHQCDQWQHPKGLAVDFNGVISLDGKQMTSDGSHINPIDLTSNPLMKSFISDLAKIIMESGGGKIGQYNTWRVQNVDLPPGIDVQFAAGDTPDHLHVEVNK